MIPPKDTRGFDPAAFRGKKACVIGLGRSGVAAAGLLRRRGFKVFATDVRPRAEVRAALGRLAPSVEWEAGRHTDRGLKCGFAVKSPGLSPKLEILRRLREKGVPVFSELEVALAFAPKAEVIAVTGTNGKTTTTEMTTEIFRRAAKRGRRVHIAGNIGIPLSETVRKIKPGDVLVLEVSSYQLEDSRHFHPRSGALLNITSDHLDHHGGMAAYIEAKARVFGNQGPDDSCVFNAGDPLALKLSRRCRARRLFFGPPGPLVHAWTAKGRLHLRLPGKKEAVAAPPKLPGGHNLENAMAAALLALSRGIGLPAIRAGLRSFKGVEHRLEEAGSLLGMRCVNDSKATNVDSTLVALKALAEDPSLKPLGGRGRIILILGGLHKGSPYDPLRSLVQSHVKCILTIGSAAGKIEEDLGGAAHIFPCADLATAVGTALKVGAKGDLLLLSPACASFDQFKNFEERGLRFKELVKAAES